LIRVGVAALVAFASVATGCAPAYGSDPAPVRPEQLTWASPPGNAAVRGAWVVGDEKATGPYLFRVRLESGARIPPHTHPDTRSTTVLSGTIHVGFGATFDEARVVAVPAGAVYVAPAGTPHYVWARDGAAEYQESGVGPTAVIPIEPKSH
jgi:quercetin dioxygenase-like cupin family protein